jgi:exopolysaccharide biosynthesis protein
MGLIIGALILVLIFTTSCQPREPQAINQIQHTLEVDAVLVDLTLAELHPVIAQNKNGENFRDMVERLRPDAAINGTFYNENCRPLGDIVVNGKLVNKGHYPNAFAVTNSGKAVIIRGTRNNINWKGYKVGIAAGPRLVVNGKVHLNPNADGFRMASLKIRARRSGIGITKDGKLLLVSTKKPFTLKEFAEIMVRLGAVDALNLDGGGACGLYVDGKFLISPLLPMSNILVVYKKKI